MPFEDLGPYYEASYPRVWSYVRRLVADSETASDLAQEAFVRLLQSQRVTLQESERTAYLFVIAMNLVRDHWKRRSRQNEPLNDIEQAPGSGGVPGVIAGIDLTRALAALPLKQRSIIWLAYAEGCNHRAIAEIVGVSEKSVKVLLFRARKKMMELLRGDS